MEVQPPSNFISDYCYYFSGTECPQPYNLWSAIFLISTVMGRRVYFDRAYEQLRVMCNIDVCLVGIAGGRKSVAKQCARDILTKHFPEIPIGGDVETPQSITKWMNGEDAVRCFTNEQGVKEEYRPYALIINELKNFLNLSGTAMVDFIVGIWDVKFYRYRTANKGEHILENPYVTILACATTEYIMDQMKERNLAEGLIRRVIFVNHTDPFVRNAEPFIPVGGAERFQKAIAHLHKLRNLSGPFFWESDKARIIFRDWYNSIETPNDILMRSWSNTKHDLVIKVMMMLALADYDPKLIMTEFNFRLALQMVESVEPGMQKLFAGSGKNPLVTPIMNAVAFMEANSGSMSMIDFKKLLFRDIQGRDLYGVINHLRETGQIFIFPKQINGVEREYVFLKDAAKRYLKEKEKENEPKPTQATPPQT